MASSACAIPKRRSTDRSAAAARDALALVDDPVAPVAQRQRRIVQRGFAADRLALAVAYGSAAAALPGTGIPGPADVDVSRVEVRALATT